MTRSDRHPESGFRRTAAAILLLMAAAGCSGQKAGQPGPAPTADNAAADNNSTFLDNAALDNVSASRVLFSIDGEPVNAGEFRTFMTTVMSGDLDEGPKILPVMADTMINNRLLASLAVKEGVDKLPQVRSRLEMRANKLWDDVLWQHAVRADFKMSDKEIFAKAPPFDELISLQQLIVEKAETAERLHKLAVGGENFDNLVIGHSIGLTAQNGGKVGYVKRGTTMYDPKVLDTLFGLKVGEFSPVIHTELGYSVFRLLDRKTPEKLRVEWLRDNRGKVMAGKAKEQWEALKEKLVRKHKVVLDRKVVDAYMQARAKNSSVEQFRGKVAFTIDGLPFYVIDLIDPSGTGLIHGDATLELIANKRVNEYAIAREVERRGLKEKEPEIALQEKLLREDVLAREYIDHRCRDLKVTQAEVRKVYDAKPADFTIDRSLDVSLIETRSPARVEQIYAELAKGVPFAEVADKWSDNQKMKGGNLGFVPESTIAPEFAEVKKIPAGEVGKKPIRLHAKKENVDLYIIARVNAVREKGLVPFDKIDKTGIEKSLMAQKREAVLKALFSDLRKRHKVEFTPEYDRFAATFKKMSSKEGRTK